MGERVCVERIEVSAYTIPTDSPESDGTLRWDSTTMVLIEAAGGGERGIGYTYGDVSVGKFVESKLKGVAEGADAMSPPAAWSAMQGAIRNAGRPGVGAMAVSAVDVALWDLKAKLLERPLADILPRFHAAVPIYGSGGFTSYSLKRLQEQLGGWVSEGIPRVKMKVGREPEQDPRRVKAVREAIGEGTELLVDANGAYTRKQALLWAGRFAEDGISYLEEPVSSEDREGLRLLRDHGPGGLAIAAGEYEWTLPQLAVLAGCVDILQADVTRCGGITNLLR
ncbi:MAG: mandelate racemase, partial [Actinomycetota bacterium]|nr:mandelate racemase [Actinomycetota bacterium]